MQTFAFLLGALSRKTSVMLQLSPHPSGHLKKTDTSAKKRQNKTKKKPDSWNQSAVRAAAQLRPRRINNGGMSRDSHLGIHSLRRFGAFCRRHARPLGLRRTPEASPHAMAVLLGTPQKLVRCEAATDQMEKSAPVTGFHTTLPDCRRRRGKVGEKKKNHAGVFLPSKRHRLSVAGGSSKEFLAHQIQQIKPQNKNLRNETSGHSSSTVMILFSTYLTWHIFHQLMFLTPPLCRLGCFTCF